MSRPEVHLKPMPRQLRSERFTDLLLPVDLKQLDNARMIALRVTGERAGMPVKEDLHQDLRRLWELLPAAMSVPHGTSVQIVLDEVYYRATHLDLAAGGVWQISRAVTSVPEIRRQSISHQLLDAIYETAYDNQGGLILTIGRMRDGKTTTQYAMAADMLRQRTGLLY
ncbi:hypothetical protein, partial [Azospirillum sp. B4]|uniref:hypothetical protein n=1 Tax=Azospirillum sp. B4 TaxID=95605 RepID=UPI0005C975D4